MWSHQQRMSSSSCLPVRRKRRLRHHLQDGSQRLKKLVSQEEHNHATKLHYLLTIEAIKTHLHVPVRVCVSCYCIACLVDVLLFLAVLICLQGFVVIGRLFCTSKQQLIDPVSSMLPAAPEKTELTRASRSRASSRTRLGRWRLPSLRGVPKGRVFPLETKGIVKQPPPTLHASGAHSPPVLKAVEP